MTPFKSLQRQSDRPGWKWATSLGMGIAAIGAIAVIGGVTVGVLAGEVKLALGLVAGGFPFAMLGAGMARPDYVLDFLRIWKGAKEEPPEPPV